MNTFETWSLSSELVLSCRIKPKLHTEETWLVSSYNGECSLRIDGGGVYSMFAQYKKQIPWLWLWYNHSCHCVAVMSILMWHSVFIFVWKFHWHKALPRRGRLCFDLVCSVKKRGSRNPQWEPSRSQINIASSIYSTYWLPGGNFYANNHIHCCGWKFFIPGQKKDTSEDRFRFTNGTGLFWTF